MRRTMHFCFGFVIAEVCFGLAVFTVFLESPANTDAVELIEERFFCRNLLFFGFKKCHILKKESRDCAIVFTRWPVDITFVRGPMLSPTVKQSESAASRVSRWVLLVVLGLSKACCISIVYGSRKSRMPSHRLSSLRVHWISGAMLRSPGWHRGSKPVYWAMTCAAVRIYFSKVSHFKVQHWIVLPVARCIVYHANCQMHRSWEAFASVKLSAKWALHTTWRKQSQRGNRRGDDSLQEKVLLWTVVSFLECL